jgi:riboflavin kinase/FMN adenylyltransferase
VDDRPYKGVASIGVRPTFDSGPASVEVFLFNFQGNLYGKHMEVTFIKHLRGEVKFSDADALVRQIRKDIEDAESALSHVR